MRRHIDFFLLLTLLFLSSTTTFAARVDYEQEKLARWQLSFSDFLVDQGQYLEAMEYINSSLQITKVQKTRIDALLRKAMLQGSYLDAEKDAIVSYEELYRLSPQHKELALYRSVYLLIETKNKNQAKSFIKQYTNEFPQGKYKYSLEVLAANIDKLTSVPPTVMVLKEPTLRVALKKRAKKVVLSSTGKATLSLKGQHVKKLVLTSTNNNLYTSFESLGSSVLVTSTKPIKICLDGNEFIVRGSLKLYGKNNAILANNIISIEKYLLSVVPSEVYPTWPSNALKAQAIAARTYAYYQKKHRTHLEYDVRANTFDQMYQGIKKEHKKTTAAVQATKGCVLTFNSKPILAQYTANSGGYSADSGVIFNTPKPYLIAHKDPKSLKGKMASWTRRFSFKTIEHRLSKIGISVSGLYNISSYQRSKSGRVLKVTLHHSKGITRLNTRTTLASSRVLRLPDILFEMDNQQQFVTFKGRGHGHGVGLSQWGAATLGKDYPYKYILSFYYPKSTLKTLW